MQSRVIFGVILTIVLVSSLALAGPRSFPGTSASTPAFAGQDLSARVQALEDLVALQHEALVSHQTELEKLERLTEGMVKACSDLEKALESSRKNGFEWAGPNPQSKTDLLEGLGSFSRTVRAAALPAKPEEASETATEKEQ